MKIKEESLCCRCYSDKSNVKMYSRDNNMDPGEVPSALLGLSLIEQQLISRLAHLMHIHMLKHGGIAAKGHHITFPQEVNEPAKILPKLRAELAVIKVRRKNADDICQDFKVRRHVVQNALHWLKPNNKAYKDIEISQKRLDLLPEDGDIQIDTIATDNISSVSDLGPAPQQNTLENDGETASTATLKDMSIDIHENVQQALKQIVNEGSVSKNKRVRITIPWPSRNEQPMSEFTTTHFFTLCFPCLFPYGDGDFHNYRPRTCSSMSNWAEHLVWFKDRRFSKHKYIKFIVHNIISRKRTLGQSTYILKQPIGDEHMTLEDLKLKIQNGDNSIVQKVLYFGACLRGTSQYWSQRGRELRSPVQYQIQQEKGLP